MASEKQQQIENKLTDPDVSNFIKGEEVIAIQEHQQEEMAVTPKAAVKKEPKVVKDGVDILALDSNKAIQECDSSLELILVTLSKSFNMSPKQAAALLTNNN